MAVLKPLLTEFGIHHRLESCAYLYCLTNAHSSALAHDITLKSGHLTQTFLVTFLHFKLLWGVWLLCYTFPHTFYCFLWHKQAENAGQYGPFSESKMPTGWYNILIAQFHTLLNMKNVQHFILVNHPIRRRPQCLNFIGILDELKASYIFEVF